MNNLSLKKTDLTDTMIIAIRDIIMDYILVANYKEIAFLVNEFLEGLSLPVINEKNFVDFMKGKATDEIATDPVFLTLEKLLIKAMLDKKKDLMTEYSEKDANWQSLRRVEFLLNTRFKEFGREEVGGLAIEGGGSTIVINIDNRRIQAAAPLTSEAMVLSSEKVMVSNYLNQRNLNTEDAETE